MCICPIAEDGSKGTDNQEELPMFILKITGRKDFMFALEKRVKKMRVGSVGVGLRGMPRAVEFLVGTVYLFEVGRQAASALLELFLNSHGALIRSFSQRWLSLSLHNERLEVTWTGTNTFNVTALCC
jgi:hypothetical protein